MMDIKKLFSRTRKRVFLDYGATTPVHRHVFKAMQPFFSDAWANPSALYREGVAARKQVEAARSQIASLLHIRPTNILFTSGGTESNNLALLGYIETLHKEGRSYDAMEIITHRAEHPSILEVCAALERRGVSIVYLPFLSTGSLAYQSLKSLFTEKTVLVTFAYVHGDSGIVTDLKKVSRMVRAWNTETGATVRVHTDASQAPLWVDFALDMLGVDMLTLDAGKFYGPKGVGVLATRGGVTLTPYHYGGGQEQGIRPGTENVPLIVGCATALLRAQRERSRRDGKVQAIRHQGETYLRERMPRAVIYGAEVARAAHATLFSLPGYDTEYAVLYLDARGVSISTRSACSVSEGGDLPFVTALGYDSAHSRSTLRITLGEESTLSEYKRCVDILVEFCAVQDTIS